MILFGLWVLLFMNLRKIIVISIALILFFACTACRRPNAAAALDTLTIYAFSVMKEPLEKDIFPAFQKEWDTGHPGQQIKFAASFGGSEMITNQLISGVQSDVAIVAIERNAKRLRTFGVTKTDWHDLPYEGTINHSPMVIVVRKDNPKKIRDYPDLATPGVKVIIPDPTSSGGAQWAVVGIYGSELIKAERTGGQRDEKKAFELLLGIWKSSAGKFHQKILNRENVHWMQMRILKNGLLNLPNEKMRYFHWLKISYVTF